MTENWGHSNSGLTWDNNLYQDLVTTYAAWNDNYLFLALKGPATETTVRFDGSADNWFMGPDNYYLTLQNGSYSRSVRINVGVPDIFRQIDNDGQFSELFDTNPMFTDPWRGRTLYNNPGDGFGFPGRLVTESDIVYQQGGSGNNCVWELAIPWSTKTLLRGYDGKEMAIEFMISGDRLFNADHAAKIKLVEIGDPVITDIAYSGGSSTITFDSAPGVEYQVYYRDSMADAWTLIEQVTGQGGSTEYVDDGSLTDPDPTDVTQRLYMVGM
jgi:hypothetical protein